MLIKQLIFLLKINMILTALIYMVITKIGNKYDSNGFDRSGYNINGVDKDGLDRDGNNINGIKGTKKNIQKEKLIIKSMMTTLYMISMDLIHKN